MELEGQEVLLEVQFLSLAAHRVHPKDKSVRRLSLQRLLVP